MILEISLKIGMRKERKCLGRNIDLLHQVIVLNYLFSHVGSVYYMNGIKATCE